MRAPKVIRVAGLAISRVDAAPAQAARQVARTILVVALAGLVWSGVTSSARADANPPIGDTTVFASVPYPGHPGGIVVDGHTVYVDTFNPVDRASDDYDAIFTYNLATGALRSDRPNPIKVPRMMSPAIMGLAAMALDAEGRLYVADMNGRIVRVDPKTGAQSDYATFPTNTMTSVSNMPAGIAFDDEGDLYVTDASAPIIWRVPPGGGEAKAWFADPALAGVWGVTGLNAAAIDPSGTYLYFSMQYSSATAVYRLPLNQPEISSLDLVHAYEPPPPTLDTGDPEVQGIFGTSGIAFGASGKLYVVLLGANQVSILRPDGTEALRFPTADQNAQQAVPYDDPLFPAFDGSGSLLVTNVAFRSLEKSVVLDAWVNDTAFPLVRPCIP